MQVDEPTTEEANAMGYQRTGACPRCGAPIYEQRSGSSASAVPAAYFTCVCRLALPDPLPELNPALAESTEEADRKHLARVRPAAEPASEEQIDA